MLHGGPPSAVQPGEEREAGNMTANTNTNYCTVGELKARIWPDGLTPDALNDRVLESIIAAVSRQIDTWCGRRFYTTTLDETRFYTANDSAALFPDDVVSVLTLSLDTDGDGAFETAIPATEYYLCPDNAALDERPYTWIELDLLTWPVGVRRGVSIVGRFGWPVLPKPVREAALLQAQRLFKRRDAPFGIISNPVGGNMRLTSELDPDVELLLAAYRRLV